MMIKWLRNMPCTMKHTSFWLGICLFYAIIKSALTIDCYDCKSQNGDHKECDDTFERDITTYSLISRNCYYGFWKAQFCIKLKGTRADGSTIVVRQCTVKNWGSHCGLIQFQTSKGLEDIDGCLESCDYDGCNMATTYKQNYFVLCISVIFAWTVWLWNRR
ncbi:uncharacterized protein LOC132728753 [Ruditapes philippinarum]|uniref:uncharacterized protein LOC132728753 n=1 Tax=Ruditapes philippinarum TaxID=129788 RepID=UPI00295A787B|nr:uncharacterized protein LOC132728753 [Ruditapes philippinarum]